MIILVSDNEIDLFLLPKSIRLDWILSNWDIAEKDLNIMNDLSNL